MAASPGEEKSKRTSALAFIRILSSYVPSLVFLHLIHLWVFFTQASMFDVGEGGVGVCLASAASSSSSYRLHI